LTDGTCFRRLQQDYELKIVTDADILPAHFYGNPHLHRFLTFIDETRPHRSLHLLPHHLHLLLELLEYTLRVSFRRQQHRQDGGETGDQADDPPNEI
jgi:hypothetical protein